MEQRFLIDTNALIDFQSKKLPSESLQYISEIIDNNFLISFISYIEFRGYKNVSPSMEQALADVIEINKTIIDQTISIRKNQNIKLPDAIIAATAIVRNLSLISHNTKDFINIPRLKLINPYKV